MRMLTGPIASFSKSHLRDPKVVATASQGLVEIRLGGDADPVGMLPMRMIREQQEVHALAQTFIRAMVALRQEKPSPVLLGEVAYVADWSRDEQDRFLDGFAEAMAESLRMNDPAPARFYVKLMSIPDSEYRSPQFTGNVTGASADIIDAKVGLRR